MFQVFRQTPQLIRAPDLEACPWSRHGAEFQEMKEQRVPLMPTRAVPFWKDRQKVEKPTTPVKNNLL